MPRVTIAIDDADTPTNGPAARRRDGRASIEIDTGRTRESPPTEGPQHMCDQSKGFCMGDLMPVIGAESAATQRIITNTLQMSIARLDVGAQKSLFEVDANETGITNAQHPRPVGGSTAPGN